MFIPQRVLFEKGALDYPLGQTLYTRFKQEAKVDLIEVATNQIK